MSREGMIQLEPTGLIGSAQPFETITSFAGSLSSQTWLPSEALCATSSSASSRHRLGRLRPGMCRHFCISGSRTRHARIMMTHLHRLRLLSGARHQMHNCIYCRSMREFVGSDFESRSQYTKLQHIRHPQEYVDVFFF